VLSGASPHVSSCRRLSPTHIFISPSCRFLLHRFFPSSRIRSSLRVVLIFCRHHIMSDTFWTRAGSYSTPFLRKNTVPSHDSVCSDAWSQNIRAMHHHGYCPIIYIRIHRDLSGISGHGRRSKDLAGPNPINENRQVHLRVTIALCVDNLRPATIPCYLPQGCYVLKCKPLAPS
jgi:hypothetical protein